MHIFGCICNCADFYAIFGQQQIDTISLLYMGEIKIKGTTDNSKFVLTRATARLYGDTATMVGGYWSNIKCDCG